MPAACRQRIPGPAIRQWPCRRVPRDDGTRIGLILRGDRKSVSAIERPRRATSSCSRGRGVSGCRTPAYSMREACAASGRPGGGNRDGLPHRPEETQP